MNPNNHNNDIIGYADPIGSSVRRRRRHLTGALYNAYSPEVAAMNAHLRALAFRWSPTNRIDSGGAATVAKSGSLLNLMRQYQNQARDNFSHEAALFVIITAIALVWPIALAINVFLG